MKKVLGFLLVMLMTCSVANAQDRQVERKVVKPPVQRPHGFGKQEWQRSQQPVQQRRTQGRIIIGQPMYYPYYRNYSWVRGNHHFHPHWCGCAACCPPVIIQPRPVPVYPMPFSGFYFQFRF